MCGDRAYKAVTGRLTSYCGRIRTSVPEARSAAIYSSGQQRNAQAGHGGFAQRQRAVRIERAIDPDRSAALANKRPNTIMLIRAEMG